MHSHGSGYIQNHSYYEDINYNQSDINSYHSDKILDLSAKSDITHKKNQKIKNSKNSSASRAKNHSTALCLIFKQKSKKSKKNKPHSPLKESMNFLLRDPFLRSIGTRDFSKKIKQSIVPAKDFILMVQRKSSAKDLESVKIRLFLGIFGLKKTPNIRIVL